MTLPHMAHLYGPAVRCKSDMTGAPAKAITLSKKSKRRDQSNKHVC
jgi:hypothetical protein